MLWYKALRRCGFSAVSRTCQTTEDEKGHIGFHVNVAIVVALAQPHKDVDDLVGDGGEQSEYDGRKGKPFMWSSGCQW